MRNSRDNTPVTVAQLAEFDEIIDTRSEAEYAEDHIPGAINCPVLTNDERARIGTLYKQVSSFDAKKAGAALVSRNIAHHLETVFAQRPRNWRPLVYCWRGGQRSGALTTVLQQVGNAPLPLDERMTLSMAEAVSGRPMPYATLMYVVSANAELDRLIANPHTGRVQKIVAGRAEAALGQWVRLERDVVADYRRAFGEPPGRLLAYGVMTDADNTASQAEAWYTELQFLGR